MSLNPLRNDDGVVIAHDDPALRPDTTLVRYINPREHLYPDENTGRTRIKSSAFSPTSRDPEFGMSVDLEQLLTAAGLPTSAKVPVNFGAVALNVGKVRLLGLQIGSDPLRENEFHGQVWGVRSKTLRKELWHLMDSWVTPLEDVQLK